MILEIHISRESHHRRKQTESKFPIKNSKGLFLTNKRTSVKTDIIQMHGTKDFVKTVHRNINLEFLVVKNK